MHQIELDMPMSLTAGQQSLLDMHSVVNATSVIRFELNLLGQLLAGDESWLTTPIDACDDLLEALHDREQGLRAAGDADGFLAGLIDLVMAQVVESSDRLGEREVLDSLDNLTGACGILQLRLQEVLARAVEPRRWQAQSCAAVRQGLEAFFAAVVRNSKGRYGIRYDVTGQRPNDYFVGCTVEAPGDQLWMPPVFEDVLRDLAANARKYTPPGGRILIGVFEDHKVLRIVVRDTGRGIPAGELRDVVAFGRRGSNVADIRTMGGGFGLTKALAVTRQFDGRMWLASTQDEGTCVRIQVPRR